MLKSQFEFQVLVNGSSAKEYFHEGKNYIEGKEGSKFSLRLKNNSSGRILFVPTVDGLSVMSGEEASFSSRGYIVNAYDSITIDGWRTSDKNVAEFFFSSPKGSYAKKVGKGSNLGVIGCAVFKEKARIRDTGNVWTLTSGTNIPLNKPFFSEPVRYTTSLPVQHSSVNSYYSCSGAASLNCSASVAATQSVDAGLGAGFGKDKYSPTVTVDFDKESSPESTFDIYYNTRKNLETLGVEFKKPVYITPSAFPSEEGYCKRPN